MIDNNGIELQPAAIDTWDKKYRLRDKDGNVVDNTIEDTFLRVATALASVEKEDMQEYYTALFLDAMKRGAIPAGRIMANAGAQEHKPAVSLINCTVAATIPDSMEGILDGLKQAGLTLKAGCGIGYDFSTLRPKGDKVAGAGAATSGPLSFMDIYDSMCATISSAGGRRGAQMATFDIRHPDVEDFITAKREDGRLRHFNCSLLVTDEFIEAVKADKPWDLRFPIEDGPVYKTLQATYLYNLIMENTYDYAEPGFLFTDTIRKGNPLSFCEDIKATNPCGEQPLPPNGACLLGSIDLTKFVHFPFDRDNVAFDHDSFKEVVSTFSRMLDNVVELNCLPLEAQQEELQYKRRHGMGFFGLGSALSMMRAAYGGPRAIELTKQITKDMVVSSWKAGAALAEEKGCAPILCNVHSSFLSTEYMQRIRRLVPDYVWEALQIHGSRYTHATSIAPTGTLALSFGNNVSSGIEPTFGHTYTRNIIVEGKASKSSQTVKSYEALLWDKLHPDEDYPGYMLVADDVAASNHIDMQAAVQQYIDSSVSKTINVPTDYPFEKFKALYLYAASKGLKGCTTFRYNPAVFQGVLVRPEELNDTEYVFVLNDGEEVTLRGGEEIMYEGETHTAANLHDAIKEGYYGKH